MNEPAIDSITPDFPEQENPPSIDNQRRTVLKAIGLAGLAAVTLPVINNIPRPIRSLIATQDENVQTNETDKKNKGNLGVFDFDNYTVEQETFLAGDDGTPFLNIGDDYVFRQGDEIYRYGVRDKRTNVIISFYSAIGSGNNLSPSPDVIDQSWFDESGSFRKGKYMKAMANLYKIQKRFIDITGASKLDVYINSIKYTGNKKIDEGVLGKVSEGQAIFEMNRNILSYIPAYDSILGLESAARTFIHEQMHLYLVNDMPMEEAFTEGLTYAFLEDYFFNGLLYGSYKSSEYYLNKLAFIDGKDFARYYLSRNRKQISIPIGNLSYEKHANTHDLAPYMYFLLKNADLGFENKLQKNKLRDFLDKCRRTNYSDGKGLSMQKLYDQIKDISTTDFPFPPTFSEYLNLVNAAILGDKNGFENVESVLEAFRSGIEDETPSLKLTPLERKKLDSQKGNDLGVVFYELQPGQFAFRNLSELKIGRYMIGYIMTKNDGYSIFTQFRDPKGVVHNIDGYFEFEVTEKDLENNLAAFMSINSLDVNESAFIKLLKTA